ncbi:MAG: hypothetical protein ACOX2G_00540 [Bacillota bacterium]|jgi:hypothetical protein
MTQPDEPRKKLVVLGSMVAVTLVLSLIVLFAALAPPSPEGVVSDMLDSLARQDIEAFEQTVALSARQQLVSVQSLDSSRWEVFWNQGPELFQEYRIGQVQISGDEAQVLVYFGPGLIQQEVFYLRKLEGRWRVVE